MDTDELTIRRITRLLLKEVTGEIPPNEKMELEDWFRANSGNQEWHEKLKRLRWVEDDYRYYTAIRDREMAWKRLETGMKRKRRIRICSFAAAIAVWVGIVFWLGWDTEKQELPPSLQASAHKSARISLMVGRKQDSILYNIHQGSEIALTGIHNSGNMLVYDTASRKVSDQEEYHTLIVGRGGEYRLTLSDGTAVWLNSESSLKYPAYFNGEQRIVELKGEGFFEVQADETHPFIVKSGDFETEVLGTSFAVMNYAEEPYARVTLTTGKLRVKQGKQQVEIHPNEQVCLEAGELNVRRVDTRYYTSWIENKFMFDDETLDVIVRKLARWYNLEYRFANESLKKTRFSGQLLKYDNISEAFKLLEMTTNICFAIEQKTIIISKKIN